MRSCDQVCGTWLILSYKRGFNKRYGHYEITSSGESEKEVQTSVDDLLWALPLVPRVVFTCEVREAPSHSSCVLPHAKILRHLVPKIERLRLYFPLIFHVFDPRSGTFIQLCKLFGHLSTAWKVRDKNTQREQVLVSCLEALFGFILTEVKLFPFYFLLLLK